MQNARTDISALRQKRLGELFGVHSIDDPQGHLADGDPLIAVVSSRIGIDPVMHRVVCQSLGRSMLRCRELGGRVLIAAGSAIEAWAVRAAELFQVEIVRLVMQQEGSQTGRSRGVADDHQASQPITLNSRSGLISRDQAVIGLADHVDVVHVRTGGGIEKAVMARLKQHGDATVRVVLWNPRRTKAKQSSALKLLSAGAVGWMGPGCWNEQQNAAEPPELPPNRFRPVADQAWTRETGQWLIHCTRAPAGCWPDETIKQYRDALMLGDATALRRGPVDALRRILDSGRLVASAVASNRDYPVVCFTGNSLIDTLSGRCFRPHLKRWDYEPFGVALRASTARGLGCRSVIYGDPPDRKKLDPKQRFRFHPIGKTYQWKTENEWRMGGSVVLDKFPIQDVRVFSWDSPSARQSLAECRFSVTWVTGAGGVP